MPEQRKVWLIETKLRSFAVEMGTAVRRRSSRPGDPELPVTDWHGMRDLLRRQASRLVSHTLCVYVHVHVCVCVFVCMYYYICV